MCNTPNLSILLSEKYIPEELVLDIPTSHGVIFLVHIKYELQEQESCHIQFLS